MRRGPPIGADNLMRDHRKIVIRDVTEENPAAGEVILAGVGVGEHYATPTWDDRGLILRGPAALEAKERARDVLERHGLTGRRLPAPLRRQDPTRDYLRQVEALEASGATARVLQVHNRTGWGEKDATFLQMLIYDLVPPGTVIYVPDSLWTSYEWMGQLVSAALRGCRVYVVAPAFSNAPSSDFPVMSTMQELVTRLVLVGEAFEDVITAVGGELRVGLYTRVAPLDDLPGVLADVDTTPRSTTWSTGCRRCTGRRSSSCPPPCSRGWLPPRRCRVSSKPASSGGSDPSRRRAPERVAARRPRKS